MIPFDYVALILVEENLDELVETTVDDPCSEWGGRALLQGQKLIETDSSPEEDGRFFAPGREGHFQFDLPGYVAGLLHEAGVGTVDRLALDTYAVEDRFFSYRRATHRGEETGGRQTSVIGMHQTG